MWEDPLQAPPDPRSMALLGRLARTDECAAEVGLYGDGGFTAGAGATFAAQVRAFGGIGSLWDESRPIADTVSSRMPWRIGHEKVTIHSAELSALVCALRWSQPGHWNLVVADRSALFSVMLRLRQGPACSIIQCTCAPLELRLRRLLLELRASWREGTPEPSWRQNQLTSPSAWDVVLPAPMQPERQMTMCRIAYAQDGLVGVDIKSHQVGCAPCPYPAVVAGNEAVDQACDEARNRQRPPDIMLPTGGLFAHLIIGGRMVTGQPAVAIRELFRDQAEVEWRSKPVQGRVAVLSRHVFTDALDIRSYTLCRVEERWRGLALWSDGNGCLDLSKVLFRAVHAVGGGWTELLHSDASLRTLAEGWAADRGLPSARVCPLCLAQAGTPRHVVMACRALEPFQELVRDVVEAELGVGGAGERLRVEADLWWASEAVAGRHAGDISAAAAARWPTLAAWRWLVPVREREELVGVDVTSSAPGAAMEGPADLAYRCVMPRALGKVLDSQEGASLQVCASEEGEEYGTIHDAPTLEREAAARTRACAKRANAVRVTTSLLLGIRKLRAEYAVRIQAWRQLRELEACRQRREVHSNTASDSRQAQTAAPRSVGDRVRAWASTDAGRVVLSEMRGRILPFGAIVERVGRELRPAGARSRELRTAVDALVIPRRVRFLGRRFPFLGGCSRDSAGQVQMHPFDCRQWMAVLGLCRCLPLSRPRLCCHGSWRVSKVPSPKL